MNKIMIAFTILFGTLAYFGFTYKPAPIDSLDSPYWHGSPHAVYNTRPNGPGPQPTPMLFASPAARPQGPMPIPSPAAVERVVAEMVPVQVNGKEVQMALVLKVDESVLNKGKGQLVTK